MTMNEFFSSNSSLIGMIAALGVFAVLTPSSWSQEREHGYYHGIVTAVVIVLVMMVIDGLKRLF
jgi:hypothetical protein